MEAFIKVPSPDGPLAVRGVGSWAQIKNGMHNVQAAAMQRRLAAIQFAATHRAAAAASMPS